MMLGRAAGLTVVATLTLIAGLVLSSGMLFTVSALISGLAVIVLWRAAQTKQDGVSVTEPPSPVSPDWDRPLRPEASGDHEEIARPEVAIEDYDQLLGAEILPSLETLSVDELEAVIAHERLGMDRLGVIMRAERLIDLTRGRVFDHSGQEREPGHSGQEREPAKAGGDLDLKGDIADSTREEPSIALEPDPDRTQAELLSGKSKSTHRSKSSDGPDLSI